MASFENSSEVWQRRDWELLQNGFVTFFCSMKAFDAAQGDLADVGYHLVKLDAGRWETTESALLAIGRVFDFPDYYGKNLNALVDCLRDVATFNYGSDPKSSGTAVVVDRFDRLAERDLDLAWTLLDILADTGRQALLIGHRFIVIVRSDDPALLLKPVGATPTMWNRREWLDRDRRPD